MTEDLMQLQVHRVMLLNSQVVLRDSEEWRAELAVRQKHVDNLLQMKGLAMRHARGEYIANVGRNEGPLAEIRLREAVHMVWLRPTVPAPEAPPPGAGL
jgi:hypothetical protein